MQTEFAYDVFLSYSYRDKALAEDLARQLREAGLRTWYDDFEVIRSESQPFQDQVAQTNEGEYLPPEKEREREYKAKELTENARAREDRIQRALYLSQTLFALDVPYPHHTIG